LLGQADDDGCTTLERVLLELPIDRTAQSEATEVWGQSLRLPELQRTTGLFGDALWVATLGKANDDFHSTSVLRVPLERLTLHYSLRLPRNAPFDTTEVRFEGQCRYDNMEDAGFPVPCQSQAERDATQLYPGWGQACLDIKNTAQTDKLHYIKERVLPISKSHQRQ
jgi:hypothetical protein